MDAQIEQPSTQATANSIMGWLRLNLGTTVMVFSVIGGVSGALISGTMRVAATDYQLADTVRINTEQQKQIDQFHLDMVDVDRRINTISNTMNDLRRARDGEVAALQQRVAVLEAQLRFLADRTPAPAVGSRK